MKKWSVILATVLTLTSISPALAAIEVSGDAYVSVNSMYLWRGFDLSTKDFDPEADANFVVQPGADISFKGFTLSWWGNINENSGNLDEVDLTVDYSFDASELVSVSVGNILYDVDGADDTNEIYLSLGLNTLLSPSVTVYYDYDEFDSLFATASVGHTFELAPNAGLNIGALGSYFDADKKLFGSDESFLHNAEFSAGIDYSINDQVVISPAVLFSTPLSDDAEDIAGIEDEFVGGVTVTLNF